MLYQPTKLWWLSLLALLIFSTTKATESVTVQMMCDNLTNGGEICCDQVLCEGETNPAPILNATLPSGGAVDSTIQYLWIYSLIDPDAVSWTVWEIYPDSDTPDLDLDVITQTTWVRRCARRAGCLDYIAESNIVKIELQDECPDDCNDFIVAATLQDISCFGEDDGAINLSVSGGTAPYRFNWSNGATTEDINNLSAGEYSGTVTDANDCSFIANGVINEPTELAVAVLSTDADCENQNGSIDLTVSGGTSSYNFNWSNGATTEDLSNLSADDYKVTITDSASGCVLLLNVTIFLTDCPPDETCNFDEGLIAYYPFNGNANDQTASQFTTEVFGATLTSDRFGNENEAYYFDGVDDYIEVYSDERLNTSNVTITAWVQPTSLTIHSDDLSQYMIYNKNRQYEMAYHGEQTQDAAPNELAFAVEVEPWRWKGANYFTTVNELVHTVMTINDETNVVTIYVNGVKVAEDQKSGSLVYSDKPLRIGARILDMQGISNDEPTSFFQGMIDDIRLYNRAMPDEEVLALYQCESEGLNVQMPNFNFLATNVTTTESETIKINWETQHEVENGYFIITHAVDNEAFDVKSEVITARSEAIKSYQYEWIDTKPRIGMNYYKIRYFTPTGLSVFSETISTYIDTKKTVLIEPNPTTDRTVVNFLKPLEKPLQLNVVNSYGQSVQQQTVPIGTLRTVIDIESHMAGIYYILLKEEGKKDRVIRLAKMDK